jgi:hypothetical protein
MVERNMCNVIMRGIVVPPGSRVTSRANRSGISERLPGGPCTHWKALPIHGARHKQTFEDLRQI